MEIAFVPGVALQICTFVRDVDDPYRAHPRGNSQRGILKIGNHHLGSPALGRDGGAKTADRSGTCDKHAFARKLACHVGGVQTNSQRFCAGGGPEIRILEQGDALCRLDDDAVAEKPLYVWKPDGRTVKAHVQTMHRKILRAKCTLTARAAGVDCDKIARLDMSSARADRQHPAGCFVAQNDRFAYPDRADAAVGMVMHVRPADSPGGDGDKRLTGAWGENLVDLDAKVVLAIKTADAGFHKNLAQGINRDGSQVASGEK